MSHFHFVLSTSALPFNRTLSIYFNYTSLSTRVAVLLSVSFLVVMHLPFLSSLAFIPSFSRVHTTTVVLCDLLCQWCNFHWSYHVFVSDLIFRRYSTPPPQHPHLIHLQSPFLAFRCCVCLCSITHVGTTVVLNIVPFCSTSIYLSHNKQFTTLLPIYPYCTYIHVNIYQ